MRFLWILFLILTPLHAQPLVREDLVLNQTFETTISRAIQFLKNRQRPDGSWLYDHLPFEGRSINTGIMVRQAGTFFALAQAWDGKDQTIKGMLTKAIQYFERNSSTFIPIEKTLRIISDTNEAYTGTICLYLAGCFWLEWKHPGAFEFRGELYVQLMNTLVYLYNRNHGLPELINTKETYLEKINRDAEPYATVQFFLAFTLFHMAYDRKHMHPILQEFMAMYERELTPFEVAQTSHWSALVSRLHMEWKQPDWYDEAQTLKARHLLQFESRWPLQETTANSCSQAEGWAYYLRANQLQTGEVDRQDLYRLTRHLRHLRTFQLKANSRTKAQTFDGKEYEKAMSNPNLAIGGFRHSIKNEIHTRIDFTQHCLSAYITHREILRDMFPDQESWEDWKLRKMEEEWLYEMEERRRNRPKRMERVLLQQIQKF